MTDTTFAIIIPVIALLGGGIGWLWSRKNADKKARMEVANLSVDLVAKEISNLKSMVEIYRGIANDFKAKLKEYEAELKEYQQECTELKKEVSTLRLINDQLTQNLTTFQTIIDQNKEHHI